MATKYVAFALILLSVSLSAVAQVALKAGTNAPSVKSALGAGFEPLAAAKIFCQPLILLGLMLYVLGAAVWLAVLSRLDLSFAYPFVAIGIVLTAILGGAVFGETFSAAKIAGTALIVAGVATLAHG